MPAGTGPVVLVIEELGSFSVQLAQGLRSELERHGIPLLVHLWGAVGTRPPESLVRVLEHQDPRAVVVSPLVRDDAQAQFDALLDRFPWLPLVHLCCRGRGCSVRADNAMGMRLIARHLVQDRGVRSPLVLRGIEGHPDSVERERAVLEALAELGRPVDGHRVLTGSFRYETAYAVVHEALTRDPQIDAIVAFNDRSALGAIEAAMALGRRVPEDIVITGFDDEEYAARVWPSLTTVSQDLEGLAATAGRLIPRLVSGEDVAQVRVPVRLVPRWSTGCPSQAPAGAGEQPLGGQDAQLDLLRAMTQRFMTCTSIERVAEQLGNYLPVLGAQRAFLVLRTDQPSGPRGMLVMAYLKGASGNGTVPGLACREPFELADLLPERHQEHLRSGTLLIQPLEFDDTEIGYLVLDQPLNIARISGEMLRLDLCRTIDTIQKTARLAEHAHQMERRTRELEAEISMRRQAEQALAYQARHDPLTGLENHSAFLAGGDPVLASAGAATVLLINLDRFKDVNDTLGHAVGDRLLREVATRLQGLAGADGHVCRIGGDEFGLLSPRAARAPGALELARDVLAALRRQFDVDDVTIEIDASIGVASAPEHAQDLASLLRMGDLAMHVAKSDRSGIAVYDPRQEQATQQRLALLGELRRAIAHGELIPHYQPVVDIGSGRASGVEALARWAHPTRGLLPPSEFIEVAEQTGLIHDLTTGILDQALADCRCWLDAGLQLVVAVNLSARRLMDDDLPGSVLRSLRRHGVPESLLVLEVTETAAMTDPGRALAVLQGLRDLGIQLSVDDFGTGHASLAYLSRLPVNTLKIDRSFVQTMETDPANRTIVRSTLDLARSLGLSVVAEGVETSAVYEILSSLRCDQAQGYWLGRPGPAGTIPGVVEELLARLAPGTRHAQVRPPSPVSGRTSAATIRTIPSPRPEGSSLTGGDLRT